MNMVYKRDKREKKNNTYLWLKRTMQPIIRDTLHGYLVSAFKGQHTERAQKNTRYKTYLSCQLTYWKTVVHEQRRTTEFPVNKQDK